MIDQSETGSSNEITFIVLYSGGCLAYSASTSCAKMLGQTYFTEPNWHVLSFFHPILICRVKYWVPGDQYVSLDNKIKCLSLAVGTTNSKPPGPIIVIDQLEILSSNLLHFFLEVHNCVAPFTSHVKLHKFGAEKPISWAKLAHIDFLTINFTVCSHILSTVGDALRWPYLQLTCQINFLLWLGWIWGPNARKRKRSQLWVWRFFVP
jgi:hypothetical protein